MLLNLCVLCFLSSVPLEVPGVGVGVERQCFIEGQPMDRSKDLLAFIMIMTRCDCRIFKLFITEVLKYDKNRRLVN